MSDTYTATKDLVIEGRPVKAGEALPAGVDPERVRRGLEIGSVRRGAAAVAAAASPSPAHQQPAKKAGK